MRRARRRYEVMWENILAQLVRNLERVLVYPVFKRNKRFL